jgi:hypothetical protein
MITISRQKLVQNVDTRLQIIFWDHDKPLEPDRGHTTVDRSELGSLLGGQLSIYTKAKPPPSAKLRRRRLAGSHNSSSNPQRYVPGPIADTALPDGLAISRNSDRHVRQRTTGAETKEHIVKRTLVRREAEHDFAPRVT